jgi:hypothetical protein
VIFFDFLPDLRQKKGGTERPRIKISSYLPISDGFCFVNMQSEYAPEAVFASLQVRGRDANSDIYAKINRSGDLFLDFCVPVNLYFRQENSGLRNLSR